MSLYQEVQKLVEKSKAEEKKSKLFVKDFVDKHAEAIIGAVKSCAARGETKHLTGLFNHAPRDSIPFLQELFPPPFKVTESFNKFILIDWKVESLDEPDEDRFGNKKWYNAECQLHREGDLPAIEWADGTKEWYVNGKRHREGDLPAREWNNGNKDWYLNGKLHRDGDLPAREFFDGTKEWWANGELHRAGGLPAVEWANGNKSWYVNGLAHRETPEGGSGGLPAVEHANGYKAWYVNGKFIKAEESELKLF